MQQYGNEKFLNPNATTHFINIIYFVYLPFFLGNAPNSFCILLVLHITSFYCIFFGQCVLWNVA